MVGSLAEVPGGFIFIRRVAVLDRFLFCHQGALGFSFLVVGAIVDTNKNKCAV